MSGGPWTIEQVPGKRFTCFGLVCQTALKVARSAKKPVLVTFHGPKSSPNRMLERSNFEVFPDGRRNPAIDPTWYTNHARR